MEDMSDQIAVRLAGLQKILNDFITFFQQARDMEVMIYEHWNAKDVLGHITFWHESFARNIAALGEDRKPQPLKGKLSEVNKQSVATTKEILTQELIERLNQAQQVIERHIFDKKISLIPYKKGSRDYSRLEHLEVVTNHITKHLKHLKKSYAKAEKQTRTA